MEEILRIYPNDNLSINIDNLNDVNANEFAQFEVVLEKEGEIISKDVLDLDIEPGRNYWVYTEPVDDLPNGEYIFTVTGKSTKAAKGLKKGAPIAHAQKVFTIEGKEEPVEEKEYKPLEVVEENGDVKITGEDFSMTFSKGFGGITDLNYGGIDYLNSKPQVTFWRPLTDTDLAVGLNYVNALWLGTTIGQQLLPDKYYFEKVGDSYKLIFVYQYPLPTRQESAVIYTVHPDGTLGVETTYGGLATIDTMPTFGMNFKLNKDLDAIRYYGYGPEENYIDTTEGLDLGVYETTVRKNFKKNERPQETGNRTGVRWAEVYNAKTGKGLRFTADTDVFEFAALPYSDLEIEAAQTMNELPKVVNTNVRIAGKVTGVGNGSYIEDWAKVDAGEMIELKFSIKPIEVQTKTRKSTPKAKKEEKKPEPKTVEKKETTTKLTEENAPKVFAAKKTTKLTEENAPKVFAAKKTTKLTEENAPKVFAAKKTTKLTEENAPKVFAAKKTTKLTEENAPKVFEAKKTAQAVEEKTPKADEKKETVTKSTAKAKKEEPVKATAKKAPAKKASRSTAKKSSTRTTKKTTKK